MRLIVSHDTRHLFPDFQPYKRWGKGVVARVSHTWRGTFTLEGLTKTGAPRTVRGYSDCIHRVPRHHFELYEGAVYRCSGCHSELTRSQLTGGVLCTCGGRFLRVSL